MYYFRNKRILKYVINITLLVRHMSLCFVVYVFLLQ